MPYVARNDGCASSAELIDYKCHLVKYTARKISSPEEEGAGKEGGGGIVCSIVFFLSSVAEY